MDWTRKPLNTHWIETSVPMDYHRESGTVTFIYNVLD